MNIAKPGLTLATLITVLGATLAGCSSSPVATTAPSVAAAATASRAMPQPAGANALAAPVAGAGNSTSAALSTVTTVSADARAGTAPMADAAPGQSVFFGFDDAALSGEDRTLIELYGRYLSRHAEARLRIEGNTDERGSAEYNLALGQKRAEAVRHALALMGIRDDRLEAISWGKERPKAEGHDEQSWAQNRRADLLSSAR